MTIRAIRIDPKAGVVDAYDCPDNPDFRQLAEIIGCKYIQPVHVTTNLVFIVDEEGLLKPNYHWMTDDHMDYHGTALFMGYEPETEAFIDLPPTLIQPTDMQKHVIWLGDDHAFERAILKGLVKRPHTSIASGPDFNASEVIWEWKLNETTANESR